MHTCLFVFFFNDTATTEIYTLSLHDALPISHFLDDITAAFRRNPALPNLLLDDYFRNGVAERQAAWRSEEHTSELQSRQYLVCRLLLEKKKHTRTLQ